MKIVTVDSDVELPTSFCLLFEQELQAGEKLERWQANSIVVDSELRLDKSIHDDMAGFEHLPKTDTQRYESFVV